MTLPTWAFAITLVPLVFGAAAFQHQLQNYDRPGFVGSREQRIGLAICAGSVVASFALGLGLKWYLG